MRIVLAGGGSGGHITPVLAVAHEIKKLHPRCHITFVTERGSRYKSAIVASESIDAVQEIWAGKFRRYHGTGLFAQLLDWRTQLHNMFDLLKFMIGTGQMFYVFLRRRPDVLLSKGGFVCVPPGLAAALLRIPYVTHDSDQTPGLANRIIARWATIHATGMPAERYVYQQKKTVYTGIPVSQHFSFVADLTQQTLLSKLPEVHTRQLLLCIGGGGGARTIDAAVEAAAEQLLMRHPELTIVHVFGKLNEEGIDTRYAALPSELRARVVKKTFLEDVYRYSGAATLVVMRAGATNIAEFAAQGKACIVIPSDVLAGGHQVQNAQILAERQAALVLRERELAAHPKVLEDAIDLLLSDNEYRLGLADRLHELAKPHAAKDLAKILVKVGA